MVQDFDYSLQWYCTIDKPFATDNGLLMGKLFDMNIDKFYDHVYDWVIRFGPKFRRGPSYVIYRNLAAKSFKAVRFVHHLNSNIKT